MTISEGPEDFTIQLRWISRTKSTILLAMLAVFFAVMFSTADRKTPIVVVTLLLCYPALLIALNSYRLIVGLGVLTVSVGPIPLFGSRQILAVADIREVFWAKTSTRTPRGRVERYALQVRTRVADKPVVLLDSECESDARTAVDALVRWLDAHPSVRR